MQSQANAITLPYRPDSRDWYAALRHLPHPVWLDSGRPGSSYGRYDILAADPERLLITRGPCTELRTRGRATSQTLTGDPFALLQAQLPPPCAGLTELPFCGGAIGLFGYDLGRHLERLPDKAVQDIDQPDMQVGIYPWAIVQDHREKVAWLVALPGTDASEIRRFHDLKPLLTDTINPFNISDFKNNINVEYYMKNIDRIRAYIHAGDCYQVNYAQRFSARFDGDPLTAFLALRAALPSPFSGFMPLDQGAVISLSPERFIQCRAGQVETQPIKGTLPRGKTSASDQANAESLQASLKDRAENLMIVDLLRNDLSKHCHTVRTPRLFELQSFANVHHLVSTVTGVLNPGAQPLDLLRGAFPGGSITGAPKIRAMEIIEELEPTRRHAYCGSLGYLSADGQMDTSITIRTLVCDRERIHCWGGGGIVADSVAEQEYQESLDKVSLLMDTLTSLQPVSG
ncbi:aminodeoxychorismate synthase component I [Marinimicrobium alkaliphilum]|uniref:aminodeoxychorismate synthase component I n=1 Tax=Marinimicrobium alkaliphilum TaxID=2202654 RepID=UPI000DB9095D|nr:aminodeoxychorismate synthase component I [Marinimicrobium alkaliphilum]